MDFVNDDELDYEDDSFEDDYAKNGSQNVSHSKGEVNEVNKESEDVNEESRFDDQYLQIDFSEVEENLISDEVPLETVSCENQNVGKAEGKIEKSKGQNIFTQNNNNGKVSEDNDADVHNCGTIKKVVNEIPLTLLRSQLEFKEKTKTSVDHKMVKKPWKSTFNNKIQVIAEDFGSNRKTAFKMSNLETNRKGHFSQNIRNINKTSSNHLGLNFNKGGSKFPAKGMFDRNLNIRTRISPKTRFNKFQIPEKNECLKRRVFYDQKTRNIDKDKNGNRFSNTINSSLQESEKKLLTLKKEARLKRFLQDDLVMGDRELIGRNEIDSNSEEPSQDDLRILKREKFISENFLSLEEQKNKNLISNKVRDGLRNEKPEINKDLLLKKKNPFDRNLEISIYARRNKIIQEYQKGEAVEECHKGKFLTSVMNRSQQKFVKEGRKKEDEGISVDQGFYVVKCDVDPHVNFVRTISKSFDELILKTGPKSQSNMIKTSPFPRLNKDGCPKKDDFAQTESQMTGCIVKVLGVPPSTTTSDILSLCGPIGEVLEVKLNFPKENSAVIRFTESAYAEKFFSFYHGRKMDNYFLNVIVV